MRIGIITLGCDKNTVDNEYLAALLEDAGCEIVAGDEVQRAEALDAVVVTTCGFIGDAKRQSVEAIVAVADRKRDTGNPRRLYVAGCLSQRYADELQREIPEVDGLAGVGRFADLARMILGTSANRKSVVRPDPLVHLERYAKRRALDDNPYAFLKIADGCGHACTFCSIPRMKGPYRSVRKEILLREARGLLERGALELNLIAQDIANYGADLGGAYRLPDLIVDLCRLEGDFWVRCLYCYPGGVTQDLIDVLRAEKKVAPYLDIPLQHLDPEVLRRMKRPAHGVDTAGLVRRLREAIPGIALRTTFIVGFPGETPQAFRRLLEGAHELRFDHAGVFQYSREEDTPAAGMPRQVGPVTRERRWHALMAEQAAIATELRAARVGQELRVLVESYDADRKLWIGRSRAEAPEVDGVVGIEPHRGLAAGRFVTVRITRAETYDVFGRVVDGGR